MPKITEVNCETGEIIEREMTEEDKAFYDTMTEISTEPDERETLKQSAITKLRTLGLTDEEIQAILG